MARLTAILVVAGALPAAAQWADYRDARTPRTKDGKPNLTAPAPRMNGKPDLSGVWQAERPAQGELNRVLGSTFTTEQVDYYDLNKYALDVFWGLKPDEEPLKPEGAAIVKKRSSQPTPSSRCLPVGVPASLFVYAFKMIQTPQEIVMLTENGDPARQIYTDGRSLPADPQPTWTGYSTGKWQGDTLAIETTGFTEESWLDGAGHPRGETMRVRENYHRRDFGHMDLEITMDDPKYYTRPFSFKTQLNLIPDSDSIEYVCAENEKDRAHTVKQ